MFDIYRDLFYKKSTCKYVIFPTRLNVMIQIFMIGSPVRNMKYTRTCKCVNSSLRVFVRTSLLMQYYNSYVIKLSANTMHANVYLIIRVKVYARIVCARRWRWRKIDQNSPWHRRATQRFNRLLFTNFSSFCYCYFNLHGFILLFVVVVNNCLMSDELDNKRRNGTYQCIVITCTQCT